MLQIVIKMDEDIYTQLFNNGEEDIVDMCRACEAIRKGTVLPKGHGRLIDANKLQEEFKKHHDFYVCAYGGFKNLPRTDKSRVDEITASIASVVNSPTVVEADKAESEG